jgi:hypothetical protein
MMGAMGATDHPRSGHRYGIVATVSGFSTRVVVALGLAGCGGSAKMTEPGGNILLTDANNYSATGSLSIPTVETAPTDLDVCWGGVVSDIQCHPVAPAADLDNVSLLRFAHLSEEQVEAKLSSGQLAQSEVDGYVEYHTIDGGGATCMKLSQLSFFGTKIKLAEEYVESADQTYMLLFTEGTKPGIGARAMTFIKPTAASVNTKVEGPAGCGLLTFSADLASLTPISIEASAPWVIDWRNIKRDGQGNPIVFEAIDGLIIGFYKDKNVADIQAKIFDLELMATTLWELPLTGGRTADLSKATERGTGAAFPGFSQGGPGVWMLGLMCSTCQNPAPLLLTVLQPMGLAG